MEISNQTFQHIRDWAKAKGILEHGNTKPQTLKLGEEYGELCAALLRGKADEAVDALGDMTVVMVSLAYMMGVTLEQCINRAYEQIKARNGTLFDGNFVKAQDGEPYLKANTSEGEVFKIRHTLNTKEAKNKKINNRKGRDNGKSKKK